MGDEGRQFWVLIAVAVLSVALGAVALVAALDAKSAGDEAADQASVERVSEKLSRLIDHLGVSEASLGEEEETVRDRADRNERETEDAVANLSNRLDAAERQIKAMEADDEGQAAFNRRLGALENQVSALDDSLARTSKRVTQLVERVSSGG